MKKASELPAAVNNLRRIWDEKKAEMKFTQVQAAEKLGWTQGAISHYLTNITELGPAATIKFANFLGVDPSEIDPEVIEHLPNIYTRIIKYDIANLKKPINAKQFHKEVKAQFWVEALASDFALDVVRDDAQFQGVCALRVCPIKDYPDAKVLLVKERKKKRAYVRRANALPAKNKIESLWAVLEVSIRTAVA